MSDREKEIEKLKRNIAFAENEIKKGKQKKVETRSSAFGKATKTETFPQMLKGFQKKLRELQAKQTEGTVAKKKKKLPPIPKAITLQPAPPRQPTPPANTGTVNVAQSGVRSLSSITPKGGGGGSGGGGGGGGGPPYGGGGGGYSGATPKAKRKYVRKPKKEKEGEAMKSVSSRKPKKNTAKQSSPKPKSSAYKPRPKRDITKVVAPPKSGAKVKAAVGSIAKKVGSGRGVKQTEQSAPASRGRIRGENTAPTGKGPKATY